MFVHCLLSDVLPWVHRNVDVSTNAKYKVGESEEAVLNNSGNQWQLIF